MGVDDASCSLVSLALASLSSLKSLSSLSSSFTAGLSTGFLGFGIEGGGVFGIEGGGVIGTEDGGVFGIVPALSFDLSFQAPLKVDLLGPSCQATTAFPDPFPDVEELLDC